MTAQLNRERCPQAYDLADCRERVLLFGTGMLVRALVAAAVDDANRAGAFHGTIVAVQSTPSGRAEVLNQQQGLFTLVERGIERGTPVDRARVIGSIARACVANDAWASIREIAARPELRVIVSNVTEAGFRLDDHDTAPLHAGRAPVSYAAKLTSLLYARFERSPAAPPVLVIPTELVPDNGPRLAAMVDELATRLALGAAFRKWTAANVRFCSSLVDRITTGAPSDADRAALSASLGYVDELLTVTEPHALWAIEGDPAELSDAFPVESGSVIFARDISTYRDRKLRLLNGAHTAFAPVALLAGIPTVRAAAEHPRLGGLFRHVLFNELVPGSGVPRADADAFARSVWDRFRNPWLEHMWSVIGTNQSVKMRIRVIPSIAGYVRAQGSVPQALALAVAAHLTLLRMSRASLNDSEVWGTSLTALPGFVDATTQWLDVIERDGVGGAVNAWTTATITAGDNS